MDSIKKDKIKMFNKCGKQLYKDLLEMYPDETILVLAQAAFKIYKNIDKRGPCNYYFEEFVKKYKDYVIKRDASFFIQGDMQFPYFESASQRLKDLWKSLDETNQQAIWDHLNVLLWISSEAHDV